MFQEIDTVPTSAALASAPPSQMLDQVAAELVLSICGFADGYSTLAALSLTSKFIHVHAQPVLYRDILFADEDPHSYFIGTIPRRQARLSIEKVQSFSHSLVSRKELGLHVISITLLVRDYNSRTRDTLDTILQRTSNLKRLTVDYSRTCISENIPSCFKKDPPPFLLQYLLWPGPDVERAKAFIKFLTSQTSIKHLALHGSTSITHTPDWALSQLSILQAPISSATQLATGRNITHLYLYGLPAVVKLDGRVSSAFESVRVFRAYGLPDGILRFASVMPRLECVQASGPWTIQQFVTSLPIVQASCIQHIRMHPDDPGHVTERRNIYKAFDELKSLKWIECRVASEPDSGDGVYERWFCNTDRSPTERLLLLCWPSPDAAWLKDDWNEGYSRYPRRR